MSTRWQMQYILRGREIIAASREEWADWLETFENRVVAQTHVGTAFVSTVFLGLDHRFMGDGPPILFETMVFADAEETLEQERCCTYDEAEAMHARYVKKWEERMAQMKKRRRPNGRTTTRDESRAGEISDNPGVGETR